MKKNLPLFLFTIVFTMNACAPQLVAASAPLPAVTEVTQVPVAESPTIASPSAIRKSYTNSAFGLGFQFSSSWFGPEEYVSDGTLRV